MHQAEVQFCTVEQIESFVNAINHFDADFQFCSEERSVNAKSIIGVFFMDFSKPLRLQYDSDDQRIEKGDRFLSIAEGMSGSMAAIFFIYKRF